MMYLKCRLATEGIALGVAAGDLPLVGEVVQLRLDLVQLALLHQEVDVDLCSFPQTPDVLA